VVPPLLDGPTRHPAIDDQPQPTETRMSTPSEQPENQPRKDNPQTFTQEFQFGNLGARVPEKVARGVFATGVLVIQGQSEFVLDFLLRMNQPHQVVARVILPMNLVPLLIDTLKANLENYRKTFGAIPALPTPQTPPAAPGAPGAPGAPAGAPAAGGVAAAGVPSAPAAAPAPASPPPSIDDIYHELKLSDEVMAGVYANTVMIVHNATEFCLEFIAKVYPRPIITARVFLSAPQVPTFLHSITQSWQMLLAKRQQPPPQPPPLHT
jgi:hypothetical protein